MQSKFFLSSLHATLLFAEKMASLCHNNTIILLEGDLGTGKTTFTRGFLGYFGFKGRVKSPTYTLVETYNVQGKHICHFDFYRISHEKELEQLGLNDYFDENTICLMEWTSKVGKVSFFGDITLRFHYVSDETRSLLVIAHTEEGKMMLNSLNALNEFK